MSHPPRSSIPPEVTTATLEFETLRKLIAEAQRGDRRAAEDIIRRHDPWLRSLIFGVTGQAKLVDDIAQQVWARAWQRLATLTDPTRLKPWLYRIARNAALDTIRRDRRLRRSVESLDQPDELATRHEAAPLRAILGNELRQTLLRAIQALPARYREPFVLRHLQDWSYAEIAELMSLPVATVETRLVRARRMLREALQQTLPA